MKLFLSSSDPQGAPDELRALVGDNPVCAFIVNANDAQPRDFRDALLARVTGYLARAGFDAVELDLREFFDDGTGIAERLEPAGLVWAHGGNAFVLRSAMRRSGFDGQIARLLATERLTYGGVSAGAIVAGTSLRGIERVDPLSDLMRVGAGEPLWSGLGLCDFAIAPHFGIAGPMGEGIGELVSELERSRSPHRALRDGESIRIDGTRETRIDHTVEVARFRADQLSR